MFKEFIAPRLGTIFAAVALAGVLSGCTRDAHLDTNQALTEVFNNTLEERASDLSVWKIELRCRDVKKPLRAIVHDTWNVETEVDAGVPCSEAGRLAMVSFESGQGYVVSARYSYDKAVVLEAFATAITGRFGTLSHDAAASSSATQEFRMALALSRVEELEFTCQSSTQRYQYAGVYGGEAQEGWTSVSCKPEAVEKGHPSVRVVRRMQAIPASSPASDMYSYKVYATKDVGEGVALKLVGEVATALGTRKTF